MSLVVNIFKCTTIMIIKSNILYILSEKLSIHSQKRPPGHVLNSHEISKECIVAFLMGCDDPSPKRRASVMDLRHRQLFKRQDLSKELGQKGKIIPSWQSGSLASLYTFANKQQGYAPSCDAPSPCGRSDLCSSWTSSCSWRKTGPHWIGKTGWERQQFTGWYLPYSWNWTNLDKWHSRMPRIQHKFSATPVCTLKPWLPPRSPASSSCRGSWPSCSWRGRGSHEVHPALQETMPAWTLIYL